MERSVKERFSIGDQYDIYENHVCDCLIIEVNGLEYLIYRYEGAEMEIYGLEVKTTRLAFNGDILQSTIYELKMQNFDHCRLQINKSLPKGYLLCQNPFECYQEATNKDLEISLINAYGKNYICLGKQIVKWLIKPCSCNKSV